MFRILTAAARSAQQRSPTHQRHIRSFHCTGTTLQSTSTGDLPLETPTEINRIRTESDQVPIQKKRGRPRKSTLPLPPKAKPDTWQNHASPERIAAWRAKLAEGQQRRRLAALGLGPKPKKKDPEGLGFKPIRNRATGVPGDDGTTTYHIKRTSGPNFTTRDVRADYYSYLVWARGMGQGKSSGDNKRISIVSPSLCGIVLPVTC